MEADRMISAADAKKALEERTLAKVEAAIKKMVEEGHSSTQCYIDAAVRDEVVIVVRAAGYKVNGGHINSNHIDISLE